MNTNPTTPMDDQERHTHIEHQTNNNCQQFFGQVTGCVFAMPGSQVTHYPATVPSSSAAGDLFKYIHPSITDDAEKTQITLEIQNLVRTQPLPDICHYLIDMKKANRIYLNVKPEAAFAELHRMGMPDETHKGFSYKYFTKYYNVN